MVVDAEALQKHEYTLRDTGLSLDGVGRIHIPAEGDWRGFVRRVAPADWREGLERDGEEAAVRGAWIAVLVAITRGFNIEWLTEIEQLVFTENKFVQYLACQQLGIRTPMSVVCSSATSIPMGFGSEVVVKPLGPSWFTDRDGLGKVVFATALHRDAPELKALSAAPFIVQEKIEAAHHLRVVTVGSRSWVCQLKADGLPLDWRTSEKAHDSFKASADFDSVRDMAVRLAKYFSLGYSSQDWISSRRGESYFLDLNPAGQWLFLPARVGEEISNEIAGWLTNSSCGA